jgi:hypothetical protein
VHGEPATMNFTSSALIARPGRFMVRRVSRGCGESDSGAALSLQDPGTASASRPGPCRNHRQSSRADGRRRVSRQREESLHAQRGGFKRIWFRCAAQTTALGSGLPFPARALPERHHWGHWGHPVSWAPADSRSSCGGRRAVQASDSDMVWLESVAVRVPACCKWSRPAKNTPYSQMGPRASLSATLRLASPGAVTARGIKRLCSHRVFSHASPHPVRYDAAHRQRPAMTNSPSMTKSSPLRPVCDLTADPAQHGKAAKGREWASSCPLNNRRYRSAAGRATTLQIRPRGVLVNSLSRRTVLLVRCFIAMIPVWGDIHPRTISQPFRPAKHLVRFLRSNTSNPHNRQARWHSFVC